MKALTISPVVKAIPPTANSAPKMPRRVTDSSPCSDDRKIVRSGTVAINNWYLLAGIAVKPQLISRKASPTVRVPNNAAPTRAFPFGRGIRLILARTQKTNAAKVNRKAVVQNGSSSMYVMRMDTAAPPLTRMNKKNAANTIGSGSALCRWIVNSTLP